MINRYIRMVSNMTRAKGVEMSFDSGDSTERLLSLKEIQAHEKEILQILCSTAGNIKSECGLPTEVC